MNLMGEITYDPSEYIKGLQQLLISDKKKIAFLFGAGTSVAIKNKDSINIPDITKMTKMIEEELCKNEKYKIAIEEIKQEIGKNNYNIETFLTNIEQKNQIISKGVLNGLTQREIEFLITKTKEQIRKIVSKHKEILESGIKNLNHVDFAEWIGRADRKQAIEIFTTNYDLFFELGMEEKNIPYYDGFTGSHNPFFNSESVEDLCFLPKQSKLWKIHGSLGWHYDEASKKVLRTYSDSDDILIYPSILKYVDSKKQPYTALMDRLTDILIKQPDTVLITCGYSFSDEHINERIFTALHSNSTAHVYALYYDIDLQDGEKTYTLTENSELVKLVKTNRKISIYGCRNAVIGCQYGKWKLKREPDEEDTIKVNLYFDEDAPIDIDDSKNEEKMGEEFWTGEGELVLPDFSKFVAFLQSVILHNGNWRDKNNEHTN
jgi:hypothetical protein